MIFQFLARYQSCCNLFEGINRVISTLLGQGHLLCELTTEENKDQVFRAQLIVREPTEGSTGAVPKVLLKELL